MVRPVSLIAVAVLAVGSLSTAGEAAPPRVAGDRVSRLVAQAENLRPEVLELALAAYRSADADGHVTRPRLVIIDYELPSYEQRLWVIDMASESVLYEEWVAHGMGNPRGSGGDMERALSFSNRHGTRKSSLGLFVTAETYQGKHGYSLKLDGLEAGVNDAARDRTIVMHPAHYVTRDRAEHRLVGRSWGCPAVRPRISNELIDAIKGGSLLWIYYPDEQWLRRSSYLARARSDRTRPATRVPAMSAGVDSTGR